METTTEQFNATTGAIYQGNNQDTLQRAKEICNYNSNEWVTYLQANTIGKVVKKGEKGVRLVKFTKVEDKKAEKKGKVRVAIKAFTVFNTEQLDELAVN